MARAYRDQTRSAAIEEAKTALQREQERTAELRRQVDERERRIDTLQAGLRALVQALMRRDERRYPILLAQSAADQLDEVIALAVLLVAPP